MTPSLGTLPIDLPKLLETRMLVQANSGAGKSWTLRRLLEQTATGVQQIVLDPEGEFASLREKFDYIVCAPHDADAVANPHTAAALARALWESGTSAIVDIYDLKAHERILFMRRFCEALINAPKSIWHPTMVVIDEIHMFAPQVGSAESCSAVIDLATRGRKRGLALVGATQRLSKLHKDVAAELLNKVIGRTGLDVDVQRAADELGMARAGAQQTLRDLEPGEVFAFGPALCRGVERTKVGPVQTSHPKTGARGMSAPPPPSKAVLAKLAKLEGLKREAEEEVKTVAALSTEVATLRRKLTIAEKAQPAGVPEAEVKRRIDEAVANTPRPIVTPAIQKALIAGIEQIAKGLQQAQAALANVSVDFVPRARTVVRSTTVSLAPVPRQSEPSPARGLVASDLSSAEQRVLDAIAWWSAAGVDQPTRHQVAFVAGYTVNGHFNNVCGSLRGRGLIDYPAGSCLGLTDEGRGKSNAPDARPTREDLIQRVTAVLKGEPMRRLFGALVDAGAPLNREDLARRCGYTVNGHFNNLCGALNGIGVAEYPSKGQVGLTSIFTGLGNG
jgi:uncharacterized protein